MKNRLHVLSDVTENIEDKRRQNRQMAYQAPHWATMPGVPTVVLEVSRGEGETATHKLGQKKSYVLGRQAGVADIVTQDAESSRQHAALVHSKGALCATGGSRTTACQPRGRAPPRPPPNPTHSARASLLRQT